MDKVIGNCSKHPGHNFVNCPLCEIERQKKLSKNFWDNVQKDVERVNPTPEGVTTDPRDKEIARLKEAVKELVEGLDSYPGFGSFSYNPAEAVAWVQKIDALIQKHKQ